MKPHKQAAQRQTTLWLACGALAIAGMLMLASAVRPVGVSWRWPLDPDEDGTWRAMRLDGERVPGAVNYSVSIRDRDVVGGEDGCNSWGFTDDPPLPNGDRMTTSTLVGCSPLPLEGSYRALVFGRPHPALLDDGSLRLATSSHSGIFRRLSDRK